MICHRFVSDKYNGCNGLFAHMRREGARQMKWYESNKETAKKATHDNLSLYFKTRPSTKLWYENYFIFLLSETNLIFTRNVQQLASFLKVRLFRDTEFLYLHSLSIKKTPYCRVCLVKDHRRHHNVVKTKYFYFLYISKLHNDPYFDIRPKTSP